MGPSVNITSQGYLGNLDNSVAPQQADSSPTAIHQDNQIPATDKKNIVIRAFKYLADRIVAAVKFVWSKIFPSKPEANNEQQPQVADHSNRPSFANLAPEQENASNNEDYQTNKTSSDVQPLEEKNISKDETAQEIVEGASKDAEQGNISDNNDTKTEGKSSDSSTPVTLKQENETKQASNKDDTPNKEEFEDHKNQSDNQALKTHIEENNVESTFNNPVSHESGNFEAKNNAEGTTAEDSAKDIVPSSSQDNTPKNEDPKDHKNQSNNQALGEKIQETNTTSDKPDSFMMVDSDIDNPSYQVARSQNEANKNQVAVNEITDIFIAKWNNVQDTVMDNLGIITKKAYDFILDNSKIYSLIKETVFDTKSSAIANHIANFIKDVKTDETIPDYSNVREMIKFDKDELKIHLVNHFSHHDKTLVAYDVYDVLVEIYSTLDYTTKRLDILPDASHIAKAGIKTLNVLLNHAYISFFKEVVSVVYEDESAKTKEEAIELLNKMVSRKFGSTYEPVTQEQIDQIT